MALAWLVVLLNVAAGYGGMPPSVPAGPAGPQLSTPSCSIKVPEPEPFDLTSLAKIPADKAMSAALVAYPGARVRALGLENENGCLVYSVLLSNGLEVKVDAGNGQVLQAALEDDEDVHDSKGKTKK
ncbi:MAG: PepSY domain-containing protein [Desulfobacca sp.]|uniref:PepSY domain-containing protein n=1 Tax=Desulfobacca sp. TaxID=2067990 RepID=UPI00404AE91C